jgi:uncharacterized protein
MPTSIFVNLPVTDLPRSMAFFSALGYTFNKQFTDEKAACLVISETIYAMLLTEPFYKTFLKKEICNTATHNEVILALSVDSREEVDAMVAKAVAAGGSTPMPPTDHGFMYQHGFEDPDGHVWEVFWMDPNVPQ